jgi:long-subunit fatty acid transport protein
MSFGRVGAVFATLLLAHSAHASGFYFGETGSKALLQGGTFAGQADDLTAIKHNPAGLSQLSGFNFLIDGQFLNHSTTFLRKDPNGQTLANQVSNRDGTFLSPAIGIGYGFKVAGNPLTIALGAYGPPSQGRYTYPAPNYNAVPGSDTSSLSSYQFEADPRRNAPQRYTRISTDVVILYPSLSASYAIGSKVALGASLQYVVSSFRFSQAVYSEPGITPTRQAEERPIWDSIVTVDLHGKPTVTAILGAMVKPIDKLSIGASFRPRLPLKASGAMNIAIGIAPDRLGTTVSDNPQADLDLTLPMEAKIGAHYQASKALGVNFDFVYEGWQSIDKLVLTPRDVSLTIGSSEPRTLDAFNIPKNWTHVWSTRLGGSYAFDFGLTAYLGGWYEKSAVPDQFTSVDFLHFSRVFVTGGVGYSFGPVEVLGGAAWTPVLTKEITNSEVRAGNTDPTIPGMVVGNGTYTSGGWVGTIGVRGTFGGESTSSSGEPRYHTAQVN